MTASKKPDEEEDLCKDLLSITVKVLADEEDATPTSSAESYHDITEVIHFPKAIEAKSLSVSSLVCLAADSCGVQ